MSTTTITIDVAFLTEEQRDAAPYTLGEVATIIPPEWKEKVFVVGAIATMLLRVIRDNVQEKPPVTPKTEG